MDSKNVIWLSSFFALLFITFCVTKHLDDLNPRIISLPKVQEELTPISHDTIYIAETKEEPVKEEPVKEEPVKEEPVKEKPVKEEVVKEEVVKEKPSEIIKGEVPKATKDSLATKETIKKPKKKPLYFTIDQSNFTPSQLLKAPRKQEFNNINKLAFKYSIHPHSKLYIYTKNISLAKKVKQYLIRHHVKAKDINIITKLQSKKHINITLRGRK